MAHVTAEQPLDTRRHLPRMAPAVRRGPAALQRRSSTECEWVRILQEDPDLGANLDSRIAASAVRLLRAPVVTLNRDAPDPPEYDPTTTFGLLVLSGLMGRRVGIGQAHAIEVLGPGDILRPWDRDDELESVPAEIGWRVFQPVRLAVLDRRITTVIGQRPELLIAFSGRLLQRARTSAYLTAASHLTLIDDKVLITLWHLANRWGRVSSRGVEINLGLTHEVIGEIVGARRPTVTLALNRMARRNIISRGPGARVILRGSPQDWMVTERTSPGSGRAVRVPGRA